MPTLDELVAEHPDLVKELTALRTAPKGAAALQKQYDRLTAEHDALKATHAEVVTKGTLAGLGIADSDDQDFVLYRYGKVSTAEGEEKPSLADYLAAQKKAKTPWLTRMLPVAGKKAAAETTTETAKAAETTTATTTATAATTAAAATTTADSPDAAAAASVVQARTNGAQLTAAQIAAMSPAEYKQHRDRIRKEAGLAANGAA